MTLRLGCYALCGMADLCVIACPNNAQLTEMLPPQCDPTLAPAIDDEEELEIVFDGEPEDDTK